jgi:putative PIN family toxin of toxin-antitoxin system
VRLVLDTNIVISAFLWRGPPSEILALGIDRRLELATSPTLIEELRRVLARRKFAGPITRQSITIDALIERYAALCELVVPPVTPRTVRRDPDDDHVIACALTAEAGLIVTGDLDLLELTEHQGVRIVSARATLAIIENDGSDVTRDQPEPR